VFLMHALTGGLFGGNGWLQGGRADQGRQHDGDQFFSWMPVLLMRPPPLNGFPFSCGAAADAPGQRAPVTSKRGLGGTACP